MYIRYIIHYLRYIYNEVGVAEQVHDLINLVSSDGPNDDHPMISSGRSAQDVPTPANAYIYCGSVCVSLRVCVSLSVSL